MTANRTNGHLPKDIEAERLVLSCALQAPDSLNGELPAPEDFMDPRHAAIARAIFAARQRGMRADAEAVFVIASKSNSLEKIGGEEYLTEIIDAVPHDGGGKYYATRVRDVALRRRVQLRARDLIGMTANEHITAAELLEHCYALPARLVEGAHTGAAERFTVQKLLACYPKLRPPLIDGILRECETANLISHSKIGKSWLLHSLIFDFITGRDWLDTFPTNSGHVLLLDFELHAETLAHRLKTVADAKGIRIDEIRDRLVIWPLRGRRKRLAELRPDLERSAGEFNLICVDAKYRATGNANENDNALETAFYDEIDGLAERMQAGWILVHHASSGAQADKRVTDLGAGAKAQSRACDSHIVLREHEEEGCAVLDAALRSFKPIERIGLRWQFPLWLPDSSLDTDSLKGRMSGADQRQRERDDDADGAIVDACATWTTRREIRKATGFGDNRRDRSIARLVKLQLLECGSEDRANNPGTEVFRKTIHAR